MSVYSPRYHAMVFSPAPGVVQATAQSNAGTASSGGAATAQGDGDHESFFHHILDVINPLQHLPVIGTIYRAITHEHIGVVERIAGDALYGGLWGAVGSVAGVAFESLTGHSVEDTVLAMFKHDDTQVAAAKVTAPQIASNANMPSGDLPQLPADLANDNTPQLVALSGALSAALSQKGVDGDTAGRALYAYRRSMGMGMMSPVVSSLN